MTVSMFDLINAPILATFWQTKAQEQEPWLGEVLFPNRKQVGLKMSWLKGLTGAPRALMASNFDADPIPRDRQGFEEMMTKMALFRENMYINEETRQDLLEVMASGNKEKQKIILGRIYNDAANLIDGASVRREILRMQLLTTGKIEYDENGVKWDADYGLKAEQKVTVDVSWSDSANATPLDDIQAGIDYLASEGVKASRAILTTKTFNELRKSAQLKATILGVTSATAQKAVLRKRDFIDFVKDEYDLDMAIYDKVYTDSTGAKKKFVEDHKFIILPGEHLGYTNFGTSPEEADLQAGLSNAQVKVVDTGVAVTTVKHTTPVKVETIVSQVTLPTFELVNSIYILTTKKP